MRDYYENIADPLPLRLSKIILYIGVVLGIYSTGFKTVGGTSDPPKGK